MNNPEKLRHVLAAAQRSALVGSAAARDIKEHAESGAAAVRVGNPSGGAAAPMLDAANRDEQKFQAEQREIYTLDEIFLILKAYEIPIRPAVGFQVGDLPWGFPKDGTQKFDLYMHPPKNMEQNIFSRDLIEYWKLKEGNIEARRVVFVLAIPAVEDKHLAVLLEYAAPNTELSRQAWGAAAGNSVEELMANPEFTEGISKWYPQVKYSLLHSKNIADRDIQDLNRQLRNPLLKTSSRAMLQALIPIERDLYTSIYFLRGILSLLNAGGYQPRPYASREDHEQDMREAIGKYREQCLLAVRRQFKQHMFNPAAQKAIHEMLIAVWKQTQIILARRRRHGIAGQDQASLQQILAIDLHSQGQLDKMKFGDSYDLEHLMAHFSIGDYLSLLARSAENEVLAFLNTKQDKNRELILDWERQLEENILAATKRLSWKAYAWEKTKSVCHYGLWLTYLPLGAVLAKGASYMAFSAKEKKVGAQHANKIATATGKVVGFCTQSDLIAEETTRMLKNAFGNAPYSRSLLVIGVGLAGGYQWSLGRWALLRALSTSFLADGMLYVFNKLQVSKDLHTGLVRGESVSRRNFSSLSYLLIALVEGLYKKNWRRLIGASGSIVGSRSFIALVSEILARISEPSEAADANEELKESVERTEFNEALIAVASIFGSEFGNQVSTGAGERVLNRVSAYSLFNGVYTVEMPIMPLLFSNPMRLSWQHQGVAHHANCEIVSAPVLTSTGIEGVTCIEEPGTQMVLAAMSW